VSYYFTRAQKGVIAFILAMSMTTSAYSTGIPTVDVANILQTSMTALENIQQTMQMIESFETQVEQFEQQIKQYESMTGSYGMGTLLNSVSDTQFRRWAPESWRDTLAVIQSGGVPGSSSSFSTALNHYEDQYQVKYSADLYEDAAQLGHRARATTYYDNYVANNLMTMSIGDAAYSDTGKRTENIEALTNQIDKASDLKAAIDLNNRLMAQNLHYQNEIIRLLAVQSQSMATANQSYMNDTAINAEFSNFKPL